MDLNALNQSVLRLIENGTKIISFLKDFTVGSAKDVSITYINADGSTSVSTFPNIAKQYATFESWKSSVIRKQYMPTEKGVYRPIVKFTSSELVSSFRMVITGTSNSFVYGGIYDFVGHHPAKFDLVNVTSSNYGDISLRISIDTNGSGFVEIRKDSGNDGVYNLSIALIPYAGTVIHQTDEVVVDDTYTVSEINFIAGGVA